MYVREAKKREEVWLLDRLEEFGIDDPAFRSRDYVIALDEDAGRKVGFGRFRVHSTDPEFCEVTAIGVLDAWQDRGVGAHILQRLVEIANERGFDTVYAFTSLVGYLEKFGFETVSEDSLPGPQRDRLDAVRKVADPDAVPLRVTAEEFSVPRRLRHRFEDDDSEESPEDFGIDPESATYKYDTGR
ncbi:Acetyltransferase (GNAT family) [Halanaeroarchaeum sp. HSR-CO]|uniref:GNAT family N-acetyltransferase n=1 Tax=Halanaeroarchaeum sp. HSR-CO TaxID=2866382 RepID=UPI00217CDCDC|nr:GNAT family N-acetyltransferase [Halanaeroarchaeum sp. HSR-CO]UWG47393.1 Acetyltransferase (GNAT family) [Halanaeroarchaeum sp. HSR-CO]